MKERRKHKRLPLTITTEFKSSIGSVYRGESRNIGFGGIFAEFAVMPVIRVGGRCGISVVLYDEKIRMALEFECRVIHKDMTGLGFQFLKIDFAGYQKFKQFIAVNTLESINRQQAVRWRLVSNELRQRPPEIQPHQAPFPYVWRR